MDEVPFEMRELLGKRFDAEIAQMFGVSHAKARRYRMQAGLAPVCRTCRLAEVKGVVNRCPQHSDEGAAALAERVKRPAASGPTDWAALEARLAVLDASAQRHADECDRLRRMSVG